MYKEMLKEKYGIKVIFFEHFFNPRELPIYKARRKNLPMRL